MRRAKLLRGLAGCCTQIGLLLGSLSSVALAQAPMELSRAVRAYGLEHGAADSPSFRYALADLDDDGRDDAIVLLSGPNFCGSGGCTMLVFRGTEAGFALVSTSTIVLAPIRISPYSVNGWRSLIVYAKGRGDVVLHFSGTRYPANPTTQPKVQQAELEAASSAIQ
jgi:hypothetical protein